MSDAPETSGTPEAGSATLPAAQKSTTSKKWGQFANGMSATASAVVAAAKSPFKGSDKEAGESREVTLSDIVIDKKADSQREIAQKKAEQLNRDNNIAFLKAMGFTVTKKDASTETQKGLTKFTMKAPAHDEGAFDEPETGPDASINAARKLAFIAKKLSGRGFQFDQSIIEKCFIIGANNAVKLKDPYDYTATWTTAEGLRKEEQRTLTPEHFIVEGKVKLNPPYNAKSQEALAKKTTGHILYKAYPRGEYAHLGLKADGQQLPEHTHYSDFNTLTILQDAVLSGTILHGSHLDTLATTDSVRNLNMTMLPSIIWATRNLKSCVERNQYLGNAGEEHLHGMMAQLNNALELKAKLHEVDTTKEDGDTLAGEVALLKSQIENTWFMFSLSALKLLATDNIGKPTQFFGKTKPDAMLEARTVKTFILAVLGAVGVEMGYDDTFTRTFTSEAGKAPEAIMQKTLTTLLARLLMLTNTSTVDAGHHKEVQALIGLLSANDAAENDRKDGLHIRNRIDAIIKTLVVSSKRATMRPADPTNGKAASLASFDMDAPDNTKQDNAPAAPDNTEQDNASEAPDTTSPAPVRPRKLSKREQNRQAKAEKEHKKQMSLAGTAELVKSASAPPIPTEAVDAIDALQNLRTDMAKLHSELYSANQSKSSLESQLTDATSKLAEVSSERDTLKAQNRGLTAERDALKGATGEGTIGDNPGVEAASLKGEIATLTSSNETLGIQLNTVQASSKALAERLDEKTDELLVATNLSDRLQNQVDALLAQVLELEKAAANSNKDHEERAEVIRSQETQLAQKDTQIAALETDLTEARSRLQSNDASVADTAPEDASADGEASGADTLPKADADDAATGVINTPDPEETVSRADTEGSAAASATTTAEEPLSVDSTDGAAPDADPDARPYEQDSLDSFLAEDISAMSDMPSLNNYLSGVQMIEKALELARKKVNTQVMSLRAEEKFSAYVTANTSPTTKNTDSEIAAFFVNRGTRIEKSDVANARAKGEASFEEAINSTYINLILSQIAPELHTTANVITKQMNQVLTKLREVEAKIAQLAKAGAPDATAEANSASGAEAELPDAADPTASTHRATAEEEHSASPEAAAAPSEPRQGDELDTSSQGNAELNPEEHVVTGLKKQRAELGTQLTGLKDQLTVAKTNATAARKLADESAPASTTNSKTINAYLGKQPNEVLPRKASDKQPLIQAEMGRRNIAAHDAEQLIATLNSQIDEIQAARQTLRTELEGHGVTFKPKSTASTPQRPSANPPAGAYASAAEAGHSPTIHRSPTRSDEGSPDSERSPTKKTAERKPVV